jgi:hypothetical protein
MGLYLKRFDIVLDSYNSVGIDTTVGFDSKFTSVPHPGTGNKIEGWKWDIASWPRNEEVNEESFIPLIFDLSLFNTDKTKWKSGIGYGDDLSLISLEKQSINESEKWLPKINHGFFYIYKDEHYLFSDGIATEFFTDSLDTGNFQIKTLSEIPKPTIPILVHNFRNENGFLIEDQIFRKVDDFSGTIVSGEMLDVRDETGLLIWANVQQVEPEFILDWSTSVSGILPPQIILNGDYRWNCWEDTEVSGLLDWYEYLGTGTGCANQKFKTHFAPLISSNLSIYTYWETISGVQSSITEWTPVLQTDNQVTLSSYECLVDIDIGEITFGSRTFKEYDSTTPSPDTNELSDPLTWTSGSGNDEKIDASSDWGDDYYILPPSGCSNVYLFNFDTTLGLTEDYWAYGDVTASNSGIMHEISFFIGFSDTSSECNNIKIYTDDLTVSGTLRITNLGQLGYCEYLWTSSGIRVSSTTVEPREAIQWVVDDIPSGDVGYNWFECSLTYSGVVTQNVYLEIAPDVMNIDSPTTIFLSTFEHRSFGGVYETKNFLSLGHRAAIRYKRGVQVDYEVEKTTDHFLETRTDINPLTGIAPKGFVHLRNKDQEPLSLTLSSELTETSLGVFGPLELGNLFSRLTCDVTGEDDELIEGHEVIFEMIGIPVGSFGEDETSITAVTNYQGKAFAIYSPPTSIDSLGKATAIIGANLGSTDLYFDRLVATLDSPLYLYQVLKEDDVLGIPVNKLNDYYADYLLEEQISYSDFATERDEEGNYRLANQLPTPTVYGSGEIAIGAKKIVLTSSSEPDVINPHTGSFPNVTVLQPSNITILSDTTIVRYDVELDPITNSGDFKSYFVATNGYVKFRAKAWNETRGVWVSSNEITVEITIPDSMNGVYISDDLSALPSGLLQRALNQTEYNTQRASLISGGSFVDLDLQEEYLIESDKFNSETPEDYFDRTRSLDSETLGRVEVSSAETTSGVIPLGFRLKTSGITLASALNGIVFLDPWHNTVSGIYQ